MSSGHLRTDQESLRIAWQLSPQLKQDRIGQLMSVLSGTGDGRDLGFGPLEVVVDMDSCLRSVSVDLGDEHLLTGSKLGVKHRHLMRGRLERVICQCARPKISDSENWSGVAPSLVDRPREGHTFHVMDMGVLPTERAEYPG